MKSSIKDWLTIAWGFTIVTISIGGLIYLVFLVYLLFGDHTVYEYKVTYINGETEIIRGSGGLSYTRRHGQYLSGCFDVAGHERCGVRNVSKR